MPVRVVIILIQWIEALAMLKGKAEEVGSLIVNM